jgi:dihydropyrimidine dehydrogenase (NAD+) subunit PreT
MTTAVAPHGLFEEHSSPLSDVDAALEADRCLECGGPFAEAPCTVACPAGIDVPAFVGAIARGDIDQAAATIFADNLLGGTCARTCPVEILCEGACVLHHEGRRPISIGRLQRHATDHAFASGFRFPRPVRTGFRVAVIGGGPAGLACAGELAQLGHDVTVYDERVEPGGLVRYAIAPYRQLRHPLPAEARMLHQLGVDFRFEFTVDSAATLAKIEDSADAVVLTVGLGKDVETDFEREDLPGVWDSLPFIEAIKTGRPPDVGRRVVVIGGGNTAIDVAREALRLGAEEVTLVYRRTEEEMPAYPHEIAEAREEGIVFRFLAQPIRFTGTEHLEGVECREVRLGEPDASGRPRPEPVAGSEFVIAADTAVKAIGQAPRRELLGWIEGIELRGGVVPVDPKTGQTANPKYFAAGDCTNGGTTVVEAVRDAKIAARGIDAWLSETTR